MSVERTPAKNPQEFYMASSVLQDNMQNTHPIAGALYRTRICKFGMSCQYGDRCFYAHSEEDIRPRAGSNASVHSCKLNESMHRSSRRSSAVLSEINYDMTSFIAESIG